MMPYCPKLGPNTVVGMKYCKWWNIKHRIFVINLLNGRDSINMLCIIRLKSEYYINSICRSALEKPGFQIRQIRKICFLSLGCTNIFMLFSQARPKLFSSGADCIFIRGGGREREIISSGAVSHPKSEKNVIKFFIN